LLIYMPNAFYVPYIVCILRSEITGMVGFDLSAGHLFFFSLLEGCDLSFCEYYALLLIFG
jgi:hypothetical protein